MNFKNTLFLTLFTLLLGQTNAQDIHNTLYYFNPLVMNPGVTGAYEGTVRLGGIYRDQARGVSNSEPYTTPSFFADAPVLMVGKRDWVGVGVMFFQDNAGSLAQKTSSFQLSAAYHHSLDKKSNSVITLGIQGGQLSRSLECGNASFADGIVAGGQQFSADFQALCNSGTGGGSGNNNDPSASALDLNVGLYLKSKVNKTTDFNVGLSARHLTKPDISLGMGGGSDGELKMRFIAHGQLNMELTEKVSISPTMYFTNLSPASQFQLQGWGGYMLNKEKNIKANFGLGYRFGDAGEILLGLDYGDLKVGLAYDLTLSALNDINSGNGGFELAVNYIVKIYKKPVVKPQILCPRL